ADTAGGIDLRVGPKDAPGAEDAVAAHFHEIADHRADLLAAGLDLLPVPFDDDRGLIRLDVRGDRAGAEVGLVAQDRVADIVKVGHLHPVKQNRVFQLDRVANDAALADEDAPANEGAGAELGPLPDDA